MAIDDIRRRPHDDASARDKYQRRDSPRQCEQRHRNAGARDLPLVNDLTTAAAAQIRGAPVHDAVVTSAAMLGLSNLISNVPAVILWLPVVPTMAAPAFVWLTIAMSSTFSGNLTLLGSMANLIVAERAEARGERLGFADYLRVGVPVTLLTMGWGIAALILVGR